jgi:hypothetical protein
MGYSQCNRDFAEHFGGSVVVVAVAVAAAAVAAAVVGSLVVGIQLIRFVVRVHMASVIEMILGNQSIQPLGLVQMTEMVWVPIQWAGYRHC